MLIHHLSDIHIRSGDRTVSRYDEYMAVFNKLFAVIEQHRDSQRQNIAIITGDVFHDKTRIDASGIKLFYTLLIGLANLVDRVYIIRGNHDYKQWILNDDEPCMIGSLMKGLSHNVQFLDSTGSHDIGENISLSVLDIKDVLKNGCTSSQIKNKNSEIDFPRPKPDSLKNILLFHGKPPSARALQGFDYALLGDQHLSRTWTDLSSGCVCGYAGSLIAQNVSEMKHVHGYLLWDTDKSEQMVEHVPIANPSPCHAAKKQIVLNITYPPSNGPGDWAQYCGGLNAPITSPESHVFIQVPEEFSGSEMIRTKVLERNKRIDAKLATYNASLTQDLAEAERKSVKLLYMKWSWLFCFGADNEFDFGKYGGDVSCMGTANATGKTSFMETICVALYGCGFPSRSTRSNTSSIINRSKDPKKTASACLTFSISGGDNATMYRVYRSFSTQSASPNLLYPISRSTGVDTFSAPRGGWVTLHTGKTALDQWVNQNVGTIDNVLLSSIVSQNSDMDFFGMSPVDQKGFIDRAIGMRSLSLLTDVFHETVLANTYIADLVQASINAVARSVDHNDEKKVDRTEELAVLVQKQTARPTHVPHVLKSREYYRVAKAIKRAASIVDMTEISDMSEISVEIDLFNELYPQYRPIKEEFNTECNCCLARMNKYHGVNKQVIEMAKGILAKYTAMYGIGVDDTNSDYIYKNYDDIELEMKISAIRSEMSGFNRSSGSHGYVKIYEKYMAELIEQKRVITTVLGNLKGYEDHLYNNHVFPHIANTVNSLISCLEHNDGLRLNVPTFGSGKKIEWTVAPMNVPIERASGFQRFVVGISARLAMLAFSKSPRMLQMFIDEGFNVCDKEHIKLVPAFMHAVRETFEMHSIFIVSHNSDLQASFPACEFAL